MHGWQQAATEGVLLIATICIAAAGFMVLQHILCQNWKKTMGSTILTLCPDKKAREKAYYLGCSLPQFGVGEAIHHPNCHCNLISD
jgi:hypothetical protein